jgi:hypothetical protein
MRLDAAVSLVLIACLVAANWPFLTERVLLVGPRLDPKGLGWRLVEVILLAALTIGLGVLLETQLGQRQPQSWEFYVAFACLFITFAFPGFVWRYLRRGAP